ITGMITVTRNRLRPRSKRPSSRGQGPSPGVASAPPSSRGASAMPHWTPSLPPDTRARPPVGILPPSPGRPQFGAAGVAPLSWVVMEGRQPNRLGESLTRRQKRVFAAVGAALVVVLGGVSVWAATDPGSYGRSGNGCVNVTV